MVFEFARVGALFGCYVPILGKYRVALRFESSIVFDAFALVFVFVSMSLMLAFSISAILWWLCSHRKVFGAINHWFVCGWRLGEHRWLPKQIEVDRDISVWQENNARRADV